MAIGYQAGYTISTNGQITAIGGNALKLNTASYNTAVGYNALTNNTTGQCSAFGQSALASNTTGNSNSAFGGYDGSSLSALYSNTTGSNNSAFGCGALQANTTASNNTAVGYQAGYTNQTGNRNVFIGYQAGYTSNYSSGDASNTAVGNQAGYGLTTGIGNTFIGGNTQASSGGAGYYVTTGSNNTILGSYNGNQGGLDIRTASNYIVLSDGAGNPRQVIDGSGNLLVGTTSQASNEKVSVVTGNTTGMVVKNTGGATYVPIYLWNATTTGDGYFAGFFTEAPATFRGSITYNRGAGVVAYNVTSDYRAKTIDGTIENALDDVNLIKTHKATMNGATISMPMFVAHELAEIAPYCVTGEKDAVDEEGNPKYQQVDSSPLIPLLVKAIQELKAEVDSLKQQLGK